MMQTVWFLWEILINSLEYLFLSMLLCKKLGYAANRKKWVIGATILLVTVQSAMNYLQLSSLAVMMGMMALLLLYAVVLFRQSIAMRILWAAAASAVFRLANLFVDIFMLWLDNAGVVLIQDALLPSFVRLLPTTVYILICALLFFLLFRFPATPIDLPFNVQVIIILVDIICSVSAGYLQGIALSLSLTAAERMLHRIMTCTLSLFVFCTLYIVHKAGEFFYLEVENRNQLQLMEVERRNVAQMQQVISAWNHDWKHHVSALSAYIEQGNTQKVQAYLQMLQQDLLLTTTQSYTQNTVMDAALSNALAVCKSEGIPLNIVAEPIGRLPLSDTEMSSLLGNALQNAMEACRLCIAKGRPPFIDVSICRRQRMVLFRVINSTTGGYAYEEGKLASTKQEAAHGFGLRRIEKIVQRANGFIEINAEEQLFRLEICIPMLAERG